MGTALPPRIYTTKSAANRKLEIDEFQNSVFQQNRPIAAGWRQCTACVGYAVLEDAKRKGIGGCVTDRISFHEIDGSAI